MQKFNDLPVEYQGNVNITEVPYDVQVGGRPHLNSHEIDLVVAFLNTLSDGYAR